MKFAKKLLFFVFVLIVIVQSINVFGSPRDLASSKEWNVECRLKNGESRVYLNIADVMKALDEVEPSEDSTCLYYEGLFACVVDQNFKPDCVLCFNTIEPDLCGYSRCLVILCDKKEGCRGAIVEWSSVMDAKEEVSVLSKSGLQCELQENKGYADRDIFRLEWWTRDPDLITRLISSNVPVPTPAAAHAPAVQ